MDYLPIEDHGIIGDLHTVALVGVDGSIDFLCFPFFDSPTIFAALLDANRGGCFQISPRLDGVRAKQLYLPDSNILLTRFLADSGMTEISDFMPVEEVGVAHNLVRRVKTIRGEIEYRMVCDPRFDYGRANHRIELKKHEALFICEKSGMPLLRLRSEVPLRQENGAAVAEFKLGAEKSAAFVLELAEAGAESPSAGERFVSSMFKATLNYWRDWIAQSNYGGRWREIVNRSALTLKLLTSQEHGSVVAAPTFGLPEVIGGPRNWDYRYCWVRDSCFTIDALMRLGYTAEATHFLRWLETRCQELSPEGALQPFYRLDGGKHLDERVLTHFEGYRKSSPVRIGNAAHEQLQLDIYGEIMEAVYIYNRLAEPISYDFWRNLERLVNWVSQHWRDPDQGIWEVRGHAQAFLHSRVMCWVALDRSIRLAQERSFPAPLPKWTQIRDEIYHDIYHNLWKDELKAFVQFHGAKTVDAAALLLPMLKFIGPKDPRWLSTLKGITKVLAADSLVYRYNFEDAAPDGLAGKEGTFTMCSFWFVECLCRAGDTDIARFYFEKMLGYANHLGLYSEELGPRGEALGNFPQAFTHLALISAADNLNEKIAGDQTPRRPRRPQAGFQQ